MISVASGNATSADDQIAAAERIDDGLRDILRHDLVNHSWFLLEVLLAELVELVVDLLAVPSTIFVSLASTGIGAAARGDSIQQLRVVDEVGAAIGSGSVEVDRRDERED